MALCSRGGVARDAWRETRRAGGSQRAAFRAAEQDLVAFSAEGSSAGGFWGRDGRIVTACRAEARGVCSHAVTMA
jgi:hypothetical protein